MINHCVLLILSSTLLIVDGFELSLKTDGPVIIGGTINFWAEVHDAIYDSFRYVWQDNAKGKPHSDTIYGKSKVHWNITYAKEDYEPGKYEVHLTVCESNLINYWPCKEKTISYQITADLNGELQILQNNTVKTVPYVSNHTEVEHKVILKESDLNLLEKHNFTVIAFWLVNCTYLGMTDDLTFRYNYTTADEDITVKAIIVAAKLNETTNVTDVFPESTWSNNTQKVVNATVNKQNASHVIISEGNKTDTSIDKHKSQNYTVNGVKSVNATVGNVTVNNSTADREKIQNATFQKKQLLKAEIERGNILNMPFKKDSQFTPWPDGSCNGSFLPKDPDKLYGYFHHVVKPMRPIEVLNVAGNNWLKNGDLLNLTVTFTGSHPYDHCIQFIPGEYNATGNETCNNTQRTSSDKINIVHYFGSGEKHTALFIIKNFVSKTVTAVVVTNYKAKTHPQLSVVIVPIVFIAIAIISIVFGVAYYIQSINRGPIEVADFDFSANNDTEYKSFKGRLLEALGSAFTRSNLDEEPEEGPTWSPSRNISNKPRMFSNSSDSE